MTPTATKAARPLLYYGWIVVGVAFVTLGITFGVWYSFSVFFLTIIKDLGWSSGQGSSIFSVFLLCHAFAGLLAGHLQDRLGPRVVIPCGACLLALALILTSRSTRLWHFYLAYGLLAGTSVSLLGFISHAAFLPKWFDRRRGLAVGLAMSGIGFGMLLLVPLAERSIAAFGWRSAYVLMALAVVAVIAPLNLAAARRHPGTLYSAKAEGRAPNARRRPAMGVEIVDPIWANRDWTLPQALRTRRLWFLLAAFFFQSYAYQGALLHAVAAMLDAGLSRNKAAVLFGFLGLAGSAGKVLFGYLSDRLGREVTSTLGIGTALVGIVCLIFAAVAPGPLPILFALFFGLGYGAAAPLFPAISADIFIGRSFGLIFAVICIGSGFGGATGSFLSGVLRDAGGAYSLPLTLCGFSLLLSSLCIWAAGPRKIRRMVIERPSAAETRENGCDG